MINDVDFLDLVKIVSSIEKNKKQVTKLNINSSNNDDINQVITRIKSTNKVDEKLNIIKLYEINHTLITKQDYEDLLIKEAKLLDLIDYKECGDNYIYNNQGILSPINSFVIYKNFSILELKRYIHWKNKILNGVFIYANSRFIHLFINEIFHEINCDNPKTGFELLMFLYINLIKLSKRNENIFIQVILEYIYTFDIDIEKSYSSEDFLKKILRCETDNKIDEAYVSKIIMNSVEFTFSDNEQMKLYKVIEVINKHLTKHGYSLFNLIYQSKIVKYPYSVNWILLSEVKKEIKDIKVNEYKIHFGIDYYSFPQFHITSNYLAYLKFLGLKVLGSKIKRYNHFENDNISKVLKSDELNDEIDMILANPYIITKVKVDEEKLQKIRLISDEISEKLLTDFDKEQLEEKEIIKENNLNEIDIKFISMLLEKSNRRILEKFATDNKTMLVLLIDRINELLFAEFNDNIIDDDGENVTIYDDYIELLKDYLRRQQ